MGRKKRGKRSGSEWNGEYDDEVNENKEKGEREWKKIKAIK